MDIELWSRVPCWRRPITSDWSVFECVDAKEVDHLSKSIVHDRWRQRYLFTIKVFEMVVYGVRRHCLTIFEPGETLKL